MANTSAIRREIQDQFERAIFVRGLIRSVYYVDSVNGSASYAGTKADEALPDIQSAIDAADVDATIIVLPNHAETISGAAAIALDTAGQNIIGIGNGLRRPTITLDNSLASISVSAAGCLIQNIDFLAAASGGVVVGIGITASGDGTVLKDLLMRDTSSSAEWLNPITVATGATNVLIDGLVYRGVAGGSTINCIKAVGAADYLQVKNFSIMGDFSGAAIDALTAASLFIDIGPGEIINVDTTAGLSVSAHASTTGMVHDLRITELKDTVGPAGAGLCYHEVYTSNAVNAQGIIQIPAVDS